MNAENYGRQAIEIARNFEVALIQINWHAFWLSLLVVLVIEVLHAAKVFPKDKYSRWRLSLLLTASLTPALLCAWSALAGYLHSPFAEAPFLGQLVLEHIPGFALKPREWKLAESVEEFVISCFALWLLLYPLLSYLQSRPLRRLIKQHEENPPFWLDENKSHWQREIWEDLLRRFRFRRPVRIIEIENEGPMTVGWWRPIIVIPDGFSSKGAVLHDPAAIRAALGHELAHIRYHSVWTMLHRLVVWLFPLPQVPVWLFNNLRKRLQQLQMDTTQATGFIGAQAAAEIQSRWSLSRSSLLRLEVERIVASIPDPAVLMDAEFEYHADFAAVRRGGADPEILKRTLLDLLLIEAQAQEFKKEIHQIVSSGGDFERILGRIEKKAGLFGAQHGLFAELPPETGLSLWAKIWKALLTLIAIHPVSVAMIPMLVFLADQHSSLTGPPLGFSGRLAQSAPAPTRSVATNQRRDFHIKTKSQVALSRRNPLPVQEPNPKPPEIASGGSVRGPSSTSAQSSPARTPTTPSQHNPAFEYAAQRMAAIGEQARIAQESSLRQANATAAQQRQAQQMNQSLQLQESQRRTAQMNAGNERMQRDLANTTRTLQQAQQIQRNIDLAQSVQNLQLQNLGAAQMAQKQSQISLDTAASNNRLLQQQAIQQNQMRQSAMHQNSVRTDPQIRHDYTLTAHSQQHTRVAQETMRLNKLPHQIPHQPYLPPNISQPHIPAPMPNIAPPPVAQPRIATPQAQPFTPPPITQPRIPNPPPAPFIPPMISQPRIINRPPQPIMTPTFTQPRIVTPPSPPPTFTPFHVR